MQPVIDVLFGPADFGGLPAQDLRDTACVVFDILRATSTLVTVLDLGARAVRPVATIAEAVEERQRDASVLLAGERGGRRIGVETAGIDFDFGNSPREFGDGRVRGRVVVMTTTNGTRALRACAGAGWVAAGAFLNLSAVAQAARAAGRARVLLVCSGTGEDPALEDTLAAGALAETLDPAGAGWTDAARIAVGVWRASKSDPALGAERSANGRRLLGMPDLAGDVAYCLRRDVTACVPLLREGRELVRGEA